MSRSQERLVVFEIVFASLYQDFADFDDFHKFVVSEHPGSLSTFQSDLIDNYFVNKQKYIKEISVFLKEDWTWERLGMVEQTVLLLALAEASIDAAPKAVIINEALITIKNYGVNENYRYINAILDKMLD